jgi:hypothetical protein
MNGYAHESHFGPPSELIDVARFILSAFTSSSSVLSTVSDSWKEVSEVQRDVIANECRSVRSTLETFVVFDISRTAFQTSKILSWPYGTTLNLQLVSPEITQSPLVEFTTQPSHPTDASGKLPNS